MKKFLLVALLLAMVCNLFAAGQREMKAVDLGKEWTQAEIYGAMNKVGKWQIRNPGWHAKNGWLWGALMSGMMEWNRIALENDDKMVLDWMLKVFDNVDWTLGTWLNDYHADDHCIGWTYLELYRSLVDCHKCDDTQKAKMIADVKARFDWILANPADVPLEYVAADWRRYSWCDALFMGPPVWHNLAQLTGETKYSDFANSEWWASTEYLFDDEEGFYYRDSKFFDSRESNGAKVFWGRGNGWVLAGIPRVLKYLPENHNDRDKYIKLFQKMAASTLAAQGEDGFWRASLLDPDAYPTPETSATGFFCYALIKGYNEGWLDESYKEASLKAWNALQGAVLPNGKLGWVQPVGEDPKKVEWNMTEVYGVGAYLLAGAEWYNTVK